MKIKSLFSYDSLSFSYILSISSFLVTVERKVIRVLTKVTKSWIKSYDWSPFTSIVQIYATKFSTVDTRCWKKKINGGKGKKLVCLRIRNEFRRLTTRQIVLFLADRNSIEEKAPRRRVCVQNDQHAPCWPAEKCSTILFPISPQRGHFGFDYLRPPGRHRDLRLPVNVLVPNFTASCTWLCCKRKRYTNSPTINPCNNQIRSFLWRKHIYYDKYFL